MAKDKTNNPSMAKAITGSGYDKVLEADDNWQSPLEGLIMLLAGLALAAVVFVIVFIVKFFIG